MSQHGDVKMHLQERLDRVLRRVGQIEADLRSTPDRDWQERASELENDEVLEGLDALSLAEVLQIREALRRIESGSYGICSHCGQSISAKRLAAIPTVVTCVGCAR
jgi:DnaK suppressor protein